MARASRILAAGPDLANDPDPFVANEPAGLRYGEWLSLSHHLYGQGADDADPVDRWLERERLTTVLEQVRGVGPQRIAAIVDQYGTLRSLRQADVEDLARSAKIPRSLAERIKSAV